MAAGVLRVVFVYDLSLSPYLARLLSRHSGYCQGCVSCFRVFSSWRSCLAWFRLPRMGEGYVGTIIRYSQEVFRWFEEDLFPVSFADTEQYLLFRTWDQKLSPGLMLLTFMATHLFHVSFASACGHGKDQTTYHFDVQNGAYTK